MNLGQDSEASFVQVFNFRFSQGADFWLRLRSRILVNILKLGLVKILTLDLVKMLMFGRNIEVNYLINIRKL